jgi:hypothetical protein
MSDSLPFFLYEAVLSLYPLGTDGTPLTSQPVWTSAVANNLRLALEYDEVRMMSSGDLYQTTHHVDEGHTIDIEQTWLLPKAPFLAAGQSQSQSQSVAVRDFVPQRNTQYALEVVWFSAGFWYRRTYIGVTGRSAGWDSVRALQFGTKQAYRAQYYKEEGGYIPQPVGSSGQVPQSVYTPLPVTPAGTSEQQCIGFFRENAMVVGEYMLGNYRWPVDVDLVSAMVVAFAPQNAPVVLTLEIGGVLTDQTVTIPVGTTNTEVSATVALNYTVTAGQSVRWQITSGPDPEDSAYVAALAIQVVLP